MASPEVEMPELSVGEVAAMSDLELGQFLLKHRRPDGAYELPVDGWDKLSEDERGRLAERLKAQQLCLAQSPTACSRPLDLDDLDARLRRVPADKSFTLRHETPAVEWQSTPSPHECITKNAGFLYHDLVNDGGRPIYPVELSWDIDQNPDKYAEILRPWSSCPTRWSRQSPLQRQVKRWQDFRKWQNDNRAREDDNDNFPAFVEYMKVLTKRYSTIVSQRIAEIEANPSCLESQWEDEQWSRERQRRRCRERGCSGFRDYSEAVKRRLKCHDFTHQFELDEDPKKQDEWTTWIEYLGFECWWLDRHIDNVQRLTPGHDKAWQELVDMKILKPHENQEFLRTDESAEERWMELEAARGAVQRRQSEAERIHRLTQKGPQRLSIPEAKRISMLRAGSTKLIAAEERVQQLMSEDKRIADFVAVQRNYVNEQEAVICHRRLVEWVQEQIPLIEAETGRSKAKRAEPSQVEGTKRKLGTTDEGPLERRTAKKKTVRFREPSPATSEDASGSSQVSEAVDDVGPVSTETTGQGPRQSICLEIRRAPSGDQGGGS